MSSLISKPSSRRSRHFVVRVGLAMVACMGMFFAPHAGADEILLCYNYGCATRQSVMLTSAELNSASSTLRKSRTAVAERAALSQAVAQLYRAAAKRSPIENDRPENTADEEELEGRMDCIDHSTNTTAFLMLLERKGWLRFHRVEEPLQRGLFAAHWGARISERFGTRSWIVDTWFRPPGERAAVFEEEVWLAGASAPPLSMERPLAAKRAIAP